MAGEHMQQVASLLAQADELDRLAPRDFPQGRRAELVEEAKVHAVLHLADKLNEAVGVLSEVVGALRAKW